MAIKSVDLIPDVILIGFASLEVDEGVQLWANVALVSPSIRVTTEYALDLSAVGQAASAKKCNDMRGKDGFHGNPGLPGGNLRVVCGNLTDNDHMLRATLSRGQRGGDAQDGGDGISGADSKYDENTFLNAINSEIRQGLLCDTGKTLPRDLKGGLRLVRFEKVDSPLGGAFCGTPGRKDLTIIKNPESGSRRRPAGSGGRGGDGGKGGVFVIRSGRNVWEGAGSTGRQGMDGIAGAASRDGCSSPRFTATIQQWYNEGGWYRSYASAPKIEVTAEPVPIEDQPKLIGSKPVTGKGRDAIYNKCLGLGFLRVKFGEQRSHLACTIRNCDFSDLMVNWA